MSVNQRVIAAQLSLSPATVSRSLRNDPTINPSTRAKVLDLASRMGYRLPLSAFRREETKRSAERCAVGVLISNPEGFRDDQSRAGHYMLAGVSEAATQLDMDLTVHFVSPDTNVLDPANQPRAMRSGELQGLILLYPFSAEVTEGLAHSLPCVTIVHHHPGLRVDCVDTDQVTAISSLVERLYQLGHRRIGFLSWLRRRSWVYRRFSGYVEGLTRAGLVFDPSVVLNVYGSILDEQAQADVVMRLVDAGVTAWVCAADHIAFSLCRRLSCNGLTIGRDVSITGYDGMEHPPDCPLLTTARVPFQELGYSALRRLQSRIRHPSAVARDVLLKCDIVEGKSTGPAPASK